MEDPIASSYTHFLKRDPLYDHEKPYSLRFTAPEGFRRANILLEKHAIRVRDIRDSRQQPSLEKDGCALLNFHSTMRYSDFDSEIRIKDTYLKEVANTLKTLLQAQHVQIFEHTVRKRHQTFPISTGQPYQYNQPTSIAHVDTTTPWALAMARQLNLTRGDQIVKHRVQCINFWKPLKGPVRDWPLALCSASSIKSPSSQLEPCDLVYPDYVVENRQVYYDGDLDWLYVSGQLEHEAWVFLQSDTNPVTKPVVHTAFPLTNDTAPSTAPARESIEVRALVYYGGFEDLEDAGVDVSKSITPS